MKNRKILIIAPACVPITGAEAIVNAKLLSALSKDGRFEIDLITKRVKIGTYPSDPNFEEFGIKIGRQEIIEVDNTISFSSIYNHLKSFFKFGTVSKGSHWAIAALPYAEKWIKECKYDYVLTKNFPSLLIGAYLKKKYGIKWVATWNDPFPVIKYPSPYGMGANARLNYMDHQLLNIMKEADIHIFPSVRLKNYMNSYLKIPESKTLIIPHVAFKNSETCTDLKSTDKLQILHSGNLSSPRTAKYLLRALRKFLDKKPDANVHLSIQGKIDTSDLDIITTLKLNDYVTIIKPLPYLDSLRDLKKFNIAVIIEAPCSEGVFLPTKVSDFMECCIPILALSPKNGVLNDLYKNFNVPYFAVTNDIDDILSQLEYIYNDFEKNCLKKSKCCPDYLPEVIVEQYLSL